MKVALKDVHPKLRNITHSLISRNPRERMFVAQVSLLLVTFLPDVIQSTKVNPPPSHCAMYQYVECHFLLLLLLLALVECWCMHIPFAQEGRVEWTTLTERRGEERRMNSKSIVSHATLILKGSCIHVNTTKIRNITCTLVATCVILRSLEWLYELCGGWNKKLRQSLLDFKFL